MTIADDTVSLEVSFEGLLLMVSMIPAMMNNMAFFLKHTQFKTRVQKSYPV